MKKKVLAGMFTAAVIMSTMGITAFAGQWQMSGSQWTYVEDNGRVLTNEWRKGADNQWRWLNSSGVMAVNSWADEDYYVDGDGKIVTNKWMKLADPDDENEDTVWYYFGNSGKKVTDGWAKINGKYYYFDDEGVMQTGWVDEDRYYLGEDGAMKTGWVYLEDPTDDDDDDDGGPNIYSNPSDDEDTHWYYFDDNGKKYEPGTTTAGYAMKKIGGTYYCFDEKGAMQTGWVNMGDAEDGSFENFRYFKDNGALQTKWARLTPPEEDDFGIDYGTDVQWYYFNDKGVPRVGNDLEHATTDDLEKINGITYLFNEKGNPVYGLRKLEIGSTDNYATYYFGADQATSSVITGKGMVEEGDGSTHEYFFSEGSGAKGRGITGVKDNKLYYMGRLQEAEGSSYRIVRLEENNYMVNRSGKVMKKDTVKWDGVKFKTNSDGIVIEVDGWPDDGEQYAEDPTEPNYWDD